MNLSEIKNPRENEIRYQFLECFRIDLGLRQRKKATDLRTSIPEIEKSANTTKSEISGDIYELVCTLRG